MNQHLDKEGVLLDTESKSSILKGVIIDNFDCGSFFERVHKSLKSTKNEHKTAESFKKTASEEHLKENSDQKTIIYNETVYHTHFILALSKTINVKPILK